MVAIFPKVSPEEKYQPRSKHLKQVTISKDVQVDETSLQPPSLLGSVKGKADQDKAEKGCQPELTAPEKGRHHHFN